MIIRVAPPFALIVEDTARVETKVPADRPHVPLGWTGDVGGGLRDDRIQLHHVRMFGDFAQAHRSAYFQAVFACLDRVQLMHTVHVDQHRRRHDAAPDIDDEISAATERLAVRDARHEPR